MKPRVWASLAVLLGLAAASPAASQIEPLFEGDPVVLPGILVVGYGGPPWWTVSDADSTVYILASPGAPVAPWDTRLLELRLKGANRLILQPDMKAGLAVARSQLSAISQVMLTAGSTRLEARPQPVTTYRNGEAMTTFPSPNSLIVRFRNDRQKAGLPETRYGGLPLTLAAFALAGDVYDRLPRQDLRGELVEETAGAIARGLKVPVAPATSYGDRNNWSAFLNQIRRPDDRCIIATLKDLEEAPARFQAVDPDQIGAMTEAWAKGDVGPLIAAFRDGSSRGAGITLRMVDKKGDTVLSVLSPVCLRQIPIYRQISDRWLPDETDAVVQALKTPGNTVVVYRATDLLFVGGVLDQLIKLGFTVKAPSPRDE